MDDDDCDDDDEEDHIAKDCVEESAASTEFPRRVPWIKQCNGIHFNTIQYKVFLQFITQCKPVDPIARRPEKIYRL